MMYRNSGMKGTEIAVKGSSQKLDNIIPAWADSKYQQVKTRQILLFMTYLVLEIHHESRKVLGRYEEIKKRHKHEE